MLTLVFWGLLSFELSRRCCHGRWDPMTGDWCSYCDTGMST